MAVSPVATVTQEQMRTLASPLKNLASGPNSSNGTPKPAVVAPTSGVTLPPTMDLSEQMNEDEKRKYAKGTYSPFSSLKTPRFTH